MANETNEVKDDDEPKARNLMEMKKNLDDLS
jgi:hypothetical protein